MSLNVYSHKMMCGLENMPPWLIENKIIQDINASILQQLPEQLKPYKLTH